jgi:hypothetical protein
MQQSFKCYDDAEYCGNLYPMYSEDPYLAKGRTEYIMMYCDCPILWASRLQSAFALSMMDSKYVYLSTDWQDVIPVMHLLKEMQDRGYNMEDTLNCKLFEDNSGVLEQAKTAKSQPRTLDISAPWHPFCSEVENELIQIQTAWQFGDASLQEGLC